MYITNSAEYFTYREKLLYVYDVYDLPDMISTKQRNICTKFHFDMKKNKYYKNDRLKLSYTDVSK